MFTGIIEEIGEVAEMSSHDEFLRIRVNARAVMNDLKTGGSISVNGVCLTARTVGTGNFAADLSRETLNRTSLKILSPGSLVNLERPMPADGRFGGHIVQGHVDGLGRVVEFSRNGDDYNLRIEFPVPALRYIVEKGSICVDGISLTVARIHSNVFDVAIIPHTFENTNLKRVTPGDPVNLEFDIIAKYVERLLQTRDIP
jgi:riboflavin synthase